MVRWKTGVSPGQRIISKDFLTKFVRKSFYVSLYIL